MSDRGYLLPVRSGSAMFRCDGASLRECAGTYQQTEYTSWLAALDTDTDLRVRLATNSYRNAARYSFEQWRGSFDGEPSLVREVAIPTSLGYPTPHCALKDNVLFVGGALDPGRLVALDLEEPTVRWRCLAPSGEPDESSWHNTIRAVCIDGDRCLCIDTVFGARDPQWLVLDVSNPRDVRHERTVAIEPKRTASRSSEHFVQLVASGQFVIAHSWTEHLQGMQFWLRVFDRTSLREVSCWRQSNRDSWDFSAFDDLAAFDESLAVCRGRAGVELVDLRALDVSQPRYSYISNAPVARRVERAGYEAKSAYFCGPSRLIVVWRAPDHTYNVTLEAL